MRNETHRRHRLPTNVHDKSEGYTIKPLFVLGPSPALRLAFFTLLSIGLMTADHRSNLLEPLRGLLLTAVYPFQAVVKLPAQGFRSIADSVRSREDLMQENESLHAQMIVLKTQLQKYNALESENRHLRELLDSSFRIGERLLVAELMAVDADPFSRHITIDKGALHDVYNGQPLLDADGVVGQILHVSPLTSTAILLTDPSHALPIRINRTGLRANVVGTGSSNRLKIPFIPNNEDVRSGDLLVTSGLGGRFPPGYPVGRIVEVVHDPREPFATVIVEPSAHPDRSSQFLLVWPAKEQFRQAPAADDATDAPQPPAGTDAAAPTAANEAPPE